MILRIEKRNEMCFFLLGFRTACNKSIEQLTTEKNSIKEYSNEKKSMNK